MPRRSARSTAPPSHPQTVAATDLALVILSAFSLERPEWSVAELAEALGMYRSRIHRAVSTLVARGFLEQSRRGKLRLGLKLFELGSIVAAQMDLLRVASDPLERLSRETKATTYLIQRTGDETLDLLKFEPEVPLLVTRRVGARHPLTHGAAGKVYLAYLPEDEVERLLVEQPLQLLTARSIVDLDAYREELRRTRERGYATSLDEVYPGISAVGAPVWDHTGGLIAVIALSAPSVQLSEDRLEQVAEQVLATARTISGRLGYAAGRENGAAPAPSATAQR